VWAQLVFPVHSIEDLTAAATSFKNVWHESNPHDLWWAEGVYVGYLETLACCMNKCKDYSLGTLTQQQWEGLYAQGLGSAASCIGFADVAEVDVAWEVPGITIGAAMCMWLVDSARLWPGAFCSPCLPPLLRQLLRVDDAQLRRGVYLAVTSALRALDNICLGSHRVPEPGMREMSDGAACMLLAQEDVCAAHLAHGGVLSVREAGELVSMLAVHSPVRAAECVRVLTRIGAVDELAALAIPRHCIATCAWGAWLEACKVFPRLAGPLLFALEAVLAVDGTPLVKGRYFIYNHQVPTHMYGMREWSVDAKHATAFYDEHMRYGERSTTLNTLLAFLKDPLVRICEVKPGRTVVQCLRTLSADEAKGTVTKKTLAGLTLVSGIQLREFTRDGKQVLELHKTNSKCCLTYESIKTRMETPTRALLLEHGCQLLCTAAKAGHTTVLSDAEARVARSVVGRLLLTGEAVSSPERLRELGESLQTQEGGGGGGGGAPGWAALAQAALEFETALRDLRLKPTLATMARMRKVLCESLGVSEADVTALLGREMGSDHMRQLVAFGSSQAGLTLHKEYWECVGFACGMDALVPHIHSVSDLVFWTSRGGEWSSRQFQLVLQTRSLSLTYWVAHVDRFAANCAQTYPMDSARADLDQALGVLTAAHSRVKSSTSAYNTFANSMWRSLERWMCFPELRPVVRAKVSLWVSNFPNRPTFTSKLLQMCSRLERPTPNPEMPFPIASARLDLTPQMPRSLASMYWASFTEESWNAHFGLEEPPPLI
jgi:hypothetical protein